MVIPCSFKGCHTVAMYSQFAHVGWDILQPAKIFPANCGIVFIRLNGIDCLIVE